MPQDLISLHLTDAKLLALDKALTAVEAACVDLVALDPTARKRLNRMGDKSEAFCRQTLNVMAQNPQIVAPALGLPAPKRTWWRWTNCARAATASSA